MVRVLREKPSGARLPKDNAEGPRELRSQREISPVGAAGPRRYRV